MLKWVLGSLLALLCLLAFLLASAGVPGLLKLPYVLILGWVKSLGRLAPKLAPSTTFLSWTLIGLFLLVIGTHYFCSWLRRHLVGGDGSENIASSRWPWRWTISLNLALGILLLAVMSLTGTVHQAVWMVLSPEPLLVNQNERLRAWFEMKTATMALELACIESEWNLAEARAAFWQGRFEESRNGDASWEHQDVLFLEGAEGKLIAAVLVSRDPKWGDKIGFTLIEPGTTSNAQPMETLPKVLARFNRADPKVLPAPAKEQP